MTYDRINRIYRADDGKLFVRKADERVFGQELQLGAGDVIGNFEERAFTPDEIAAVKKRNPRRSPAKKADEEQPQPDPCRPDNVNQEA